MSVRVSQRCFGYLLSRIREIAKTRTTGRRNFSVRESRNLRARAAAATILNEEILRGRSSKRAKEPRRGELPSRDAIWNSNDWEDNGRDNYRRVNLSAARFRFDNGDISREGKIDDPRFSCNECHLGAYQRRRRFPLSLRPAPFILV